MIKYLANQKLWRVIRQPEGYFYEIKLAGMVIDRIKLDEEKVSKLKEYEVISDDQKK